MATAWRAEAALEAVGAAYDAGEPGDGQIESPIAALREVAEDALTAAEALSRVQRGPT
jgi:hypothetical protein